MKPGDRVKQRASGKQGKILRIEGDQAIVDTPDGEKAWALSNLRATSTTVAPRGMASVNDRMRAAVRMVEEGVDRVEVQRIYGVHRSLLQSWVDAVRAERADQENLEKARRTG